MADTAVAQIAVPRKLPASTDNPIQCVLLTLIVPDHNSVAALLQKAS